MITYSLHMENGSARRLKSVLLVRSLTRADLSSVKVMVEHSPFTINGQIEGASPSCQLEIISKVMKYVKYLDGTGVRYRLLMLIDGNEVIGEDNTGIHMEREERETGLITGEVDPPASCIKCRRLVRNCICNN